MDAQKMMVCVVLMMVLIATSCKARHVNDDSEKAEALDKRRAVFDAFLMRGSAKRQKKLIHFQPHYIDQWWS
jgi:hypothetical protein